MKLKKQYLKLNSTREYYGVPPEFYTKERDLLELYFHFEPVEFRPVSFMSLPQRYIVYMCSDDEYMKPSAKLTFTSEAQRQLFEKEYEKYYDQRYAEMPELEININNYEEIKQKWKLLQQEKPNYIIFTLDDSGPLDVVDVFGQNELSEQELVEIKFGHEQYLRYEKAKALYYKDHPWQDGKWYGSADNEFESDYQPYYDRDTPFTTPKIYTKQEIGLELKQRVGQQQPVEMIGRWISFALAYYPGELNDPFVMLLIEMSRMQTSGPYIGLSYEKLDKIAEAMIADEEVTLERFGYDPDKYQFKD